MNRALLIILIPAFLVAMGYVMVFRFMGIEPGYSRLLFVAAIFLAAVFWLARRKAASGAKADGKTK